MSMIAARKNIYRNGSWSRPKNKGKWNDLLPVFNIKIFRGKYRLRWAGKKLFIWLIIYLVLYKNFYSAKSISFSFCFIQGCFLYYCQSPWIAHTLSTSNIETVFVCMCVCVYICTCVHIHIYTCTCMFVYMYMYIYERQRFYPCVQCSVV